MQGLVVQGNALYFTISTISVHPQRINAPIT